MSKAYFRVNDFKQEVLDKREETFERGFEIGFQSAYEYLNLKKKYTSYIYASPFSGKSSFILNTYIYIAKRYNAKIAIFSPESGGKDALVSYLCQLVMGKKLHGVGAQKATDEEWLEALKFLDSHFIILDPPVVGKDAIEFSAKEVFKQLSEACKEYGWKLDILLIDPLTMLRKSGEDRKKSIADYILDTLYYFNHIAQAWDIHIQIAMHIADTENVVDKDTGIEFTPKPFANKLHNGQNVHRTGQTMAGLWRCPAGVVEKSTGVPYPENATDVLVQKNKILGAGEVGSFRLYFDNNKQNFYEIIEGKRYGIGEYEAIQSNKNKPLSDDSALKPNLNFGTEIESAPF